MLRRLLFLFGVCVVLAVAGLGYLYNRVKQPYQGFTEPVFLEFQHGATTTEIAARLAEKGVVESNWIFLASKLFHRGAHLQAGEYKFEKPASPFDVFGRIARGDIYYMELLIPEGFNMFDIAAAVEKLGTIQADTFLAAAKNPATIRDLDPKAESLEGYLFPNKYHVYRKTTAQQICRLMTNEFRVRWKSLHTSSMQTTEDPHGIVTLAAMVEREAKLPEERPKVASVFRNRLRIGMKLDCDPTTVYAALLENRYRGTIHRSDLDSMNPYNTYKHVGLPPGPIANPGLMALRAALEPADTPYLYFVAKADGSGGHNFSASLKTHLVAVTHYQHASHR